MMQQIFRVVLFGICCLFLISGGASAAITPDPMIQADLKNLFTNAPQVQGLPYQDLLSDAANRYGLSLPYVLAVVRGESFFDPKAKSHKGALGLMQVMPSTASDYGVNENDLLDPSINIDVGVHYLSDLYVKLQDPYLALAAYYCGPGGVDKEKFELREDCNEYVQYIYAHLQKILAHSGQEMAGVKGVRKHFVLTRFDNFPDAEKFLKFLSIKLADMNFDIFRHEVIRPDHARYQYRIIADNANRYEKDEICSMVEKVSGFSFCDR